MHYVALSLFPLPSLPQLRTKSMLSSQRGSRYKDNGRLNSSIRWKENNNVKRVDSVKVGMLCNLCKTIFHFPSLFCSPSFYLLLRRSLPGNLYFQHVISIFAFGTWRIRGKCANELWRSLLHGSGERPLMLSTFMAATEAQTVHVSPQ